MKKVFFVLFACLCMTFVGCGDSPTWNAQATSANHAMQQTELLKEQNKLLREQNEYLKRISNSLERK